MAELPGELRRFDYSDGDAAEEAILDAVSTADDLSSGSDELAGLINDWTTRYHFSPKRADLLEPFRWQGLKVLEVGPGCGALTRFLGESGAQVTAVEGSFRRATITARRCRGLEEVEVVCEDFARLPVSPRFDAVVVVGVLEYAPRFFSGSDPLSAFLDRTREFLNPDGVVLVAIENRLGMKYFAGAREDHVGEAFYGIEDRYTPEDGALTLGRRELLARLEASGLPPRELILPFPDYKLPRVLVREEGLASPVLNVGELLAHAGLGAGDPRAPLLFAEEAAWRSVRANGLVADLSNSFLIVAGSQTGAKSLLGGDWLARAYASGRRRPFRTTTTFRALGEGIVVSKRRRHPDAAAPAGALADLQVRETSEYLAGETLARRCVEAAGRRRATIGDLVDALRPWLDLLAENVDEADGRLPGRFVDCVPGNLVLAAPAGEAVEYFDAEWVFREPVAPERVLLRGTLLLASRLERVVADAALRAVPLRDLVSAVLRAFGCGAAEDRLDGLIEEEATWAAQVMPLSRSAYIESVVAGLDTPLGGLCRLGAFADSPAVVANVLAERARGLEQLEAAISEKDRHIQKLGAEVRRVIGVKDAELAAKDQEIAAKNLAVAEGEEQAAALRAVEASVSWRMTSPLRFVARRVRGK
jgi:SAM-dependent methyltransferase